MIALPLDMKKIPLFLIFIALVIARLPLSAMEGRGEDHDSDDNNGYDPNRSPSTVSSHVPNQDGGLESDDRGNENNSEQTLSNRNHLEKQQKKTHSINMHNTHPDRSPTSQSRIPESGPGRGSTSTGDSPPSKATTASRIAIEHYLQSMLESIPQKIKTLEEKIEATQAPIFELNNEPRKKLAIRYLEAPDNDARKACLEELGTSPKKDKLRERLIYTQNLKSASMLLSRTQEHSIDFIKGLKESESRPTKTAVYLSNLSNVTDRVSGLLQYADNIVELNNKIVTLNSRLKREQGSFIKLTLIELAKKAQQCIDQYTAFITKIKTDPRAARQHELAAKAAWNTVSLLPDFTTEFNNLIYEEEGSRYGDLSTLAYFLDLEIACRIHAITFFETKSSSQLGASWEETADIWAQSNKHRISFIKRRGDDGFSVGLHRLLSEAYAKLADLRTDRLRASTETSIQPPSIEEQTVSERIQELLGMAENREGDSARELRSSSASSSRPPEAIPITERKNANNNRRSTAARILTALPKTDERSGLPRSSSTESYIPPKPDSKSQFA